mmetsp:Transcript_15663/g.46930  ORF Transcript_15663/g.46930 Transcript_15663/m.46930 type:complete len:241 (-) Transcript_15663:514-1236(-)
MSIRSGRRAAAVVRADDVLVPLVRFGSGGDRRVAAAVHDSATTAMRIQNGAVTVIAAPVMTTILRNMGKTAVTVTILTTMTTTTTMMMMMMMTRTTMRRSRSERRKKRRLTLKLGRRNTAEHPGPRSHSPPPPPPPVTPRRQRLYLGRTRQFSPLLQLQLEEAATLRLKRRRRIRLRTHCVARRRLTLPSPVSSTEDITPKNILLLGYLRRLPPLLLPLPLLLQSLVATVTTHKVRVTRS